MFGRRRGGRRHFRRHWDEWAGGEWERGKVDEVGGHPHLREAHRYGPPPFRKIILKHVPFGFGPRGGRPFGPPFGHGGPFGGGPFDGDGGRRRRRGDMRYVLLELLAERPRHGYELIKELEQRDAGFYRPSPGSVYPTLQLLEEEGSLTSEQVDGKRVYTITDAGQRVLDERRQRPDAGPARGEPGSPPPELESLRQSTTALLGSVMEAARHGTREQQRAVLERLNALRREIYGILAQDNRDELI